MLNLYDRMERMYQLGPEFIDVTWGAGGTTADLTLDICQTAQAVYGLETCMHLTCTNMPKEKVDVALKVGNLLKKCNPRKLIMTIDGKGSRNPKHFGSSWRYMIPVDSLSF